MFRKTCLAQWTSREIYRLPKSLGFPATSLICGHCDNPGEIWIEKEEIEVYKNGQRIFDGPRAITRIMADNTGGDNKFKKITRYLDANLNAEGDSLFRVYLTTLEQKTRSLIIR
jgi:hypothetical protein